LGDLTVIIELKTFEQGVELFEIDPDVTRGAGLAEIDYIIAFPGVVITAD
jgi:hypothetical protein